MTREETGIMTEATQTGGGPLSDLVRKRKDELGLTLRLLEERCVDPHPDPNSGQEAGPLWGRSTLSLLINGERIKPPSPAKIRALAAGLDLSVDDVREAAGKQFFGVDTLRTGDRKVRAFVRDFEGLSPEDQRKVWDLLEAHRPVRDE
jgi:transcriptional regulator with XRE-family HTH domain